MRAHVSHAPFSIQSCVNHRPENAAAIDPQYSYSFLSQYFVSTYQIDTVCPVSLLHFYKVGLLVKKRTRLLGPRVLYVQEVLIHFIQ